MLYFSSLPKEKITVFKFSTLEQVLVLGVRNLQKMLLNRSILRLF